MSHLKVFISYSHKDEIYREELEKHLKMLKRNHFIDTWTDREILAGQDWNNEISEQLKTSQLILFLVSSDFLASDYCYDIEVLSAIKQHEEGVSVVIPIIVRHCDWQNSPLQKIQGIPTDGKPIKDWADIDKAFVDVVNKIRAVVLKIRDKEKNQINEPTKIGNDTSSTIQQKLQIKEDKFKSILSEKMWFNNFIKIEYGNKKSNEKGKELLFYKIKAMGISMQQLEEYNTEAKEIMNCLENAVRIWNDSNYGVWFEDMWDAEFSIQILLALCDEDWYNLHYPNKADKANFLKMANELEKSRVWISSRFHTNK